MKLLSFDIGIHNLAYCCIESDTTTKEMSIVKWEVIDLREYGPSKDFMSTASTLVDLLHEMFYCNDEQYDYVLIENQPVQKNPTMKSIQMIVFTFFMMLKYHQNPSMQIKFQSASNKLKVNNKPSDLDICASTKYAKNKKMSIAIANHYLENVLTNNRDMHTLFKSHKKRDDLADSMLQAVYFVENNLSSATTRS